MSEPIFSINKQILNAQSMSTDITSDTVDIAELVGYCVHAIWTGAPTGRVRAEASNDNINFVEVSSEDTAGAAGQYLVNYENQHYRYVRVRYSRTSGTGNLTVYVSGKRN